MTEEQEVELSECDSCFIPIIIEKRGQVYLVHLEPKKNNCTVYTSDAYEDEESDNEDAKEFTHVDLVGTVSPGIEN